QMSACAKSGQDALFMAISSRANAYDHYTQGKTAQATADLEDETVYLSRYQAWLKANPVASTAATPPPTPQGATTVSTGALKWSVVQQWQGGNETKQTAAFTVGAEWRIAYPNQGT